MIATNPDNHLWFNFDQIYGFLGGRRGIMAISMPIRKNTNWIIVSVVFPTLKTKNNAIKDDEITKADHTLFFKSPRIIDTNAQTNEMVLNTRLNLSDANSSMFPS